jgi:hypothetical protein
MAPRGHIGRGLDAPGAAASGLGARAVLFAALGITLTAASAVALPLWTYAVSLALFGLPHVAAELRYVDARFGARVGRGFARPLWAGLLGIVLLRLAAAGGVGEPRVRVALELGLGAALVLCVLPRLLRAGSVHAAAGVCAIALALTAARACPLEAIVWFAVLHNLTPVGFLAERLRGAARRRALTWCAVAFGAVPVSIASGALGIALARLGLPSSIAGPPGAGALASHVGAFVPSSLRGGALELDLFRAAAFLQCMHYAVVLHVLPRLGAGDAGRTESLCWPRSRWLPAATVAVSVGLTAAFGVAFADTRLVYGVVAAVHAWIEIPVLVLAAACIPLGASAAVGARA